MTHLVVSEPENAEAEEDVETGTANLEDVETGTARVFNLIEDLSSANLPRISCPCCISGQHEKPNTKNT